MGNPLLVNTLSDPVCRTATDMSPTRSYSSSDVLDSNRSSNTALPDATRPRGGMVFSIKRHAATDFPNAEGSGGRREGIMILVRKQMKFRSPARERRIFQ